MGQVCLDPLSRFPSGPKHQDKKPTLGCFWQHLLLAQIYPIAKAKNSKKY